MATFALLLPSLLVYISYLDLTVRDRFDRGHVAVPAQVFGRPLEIFPGALVSQGDLLAELDLLRYQDDASLARAGSFRLRGAGVDINTRGFRSWDGSEPAQKIHVDFDTGRVERLSSVTGAGLSLVRLEPPRIGSILPPEQEDRVPVALESVPRSLIDALIASEDRGYFRHHGLDFKAIARALWANLAAGSVVQGGSTLTQQLVKNLFLEPERSLVRKFNEAIMALILEFRYSKEQILETYLNEVYLGQDGGRSIHGFGRASQFYFDRPVAQLRLHEVALLVALVRGASYYNPRRNPERAEERRNLVLSLMAEQGLVPAEAARNGQAQALGVSAEPQRGGERFPAFMDLVRRQLRQDYRESDLQSAGLRIFTTLDPRVQQVAERAVADGLDRLERQRKLPRGELQAAVVVTAPQGGEVLAVVGGRQAGFAGFNRALDAVRPIGSLAKPAVFLTALAAPKNYTLASHLDDGPLRLRNEQGTVWAPRNYDRKSHGTVSLREALAHSYNQATVRLGLALGVDRVIETFRKLGVRRPLDPYPSLFLGAAALPPVEVAQMTQTMASGGFLTPLRAIREILDADNRPLQRYPLRLERSLDPSAVFLLQEALVAVTEEGTGRPLRSILPKGLRVAGKTGTTDDLRDSWFAGWSGDRMAVVWVGRDDNRPAELTGAGGALRIWGEIMVNAARLPLAERAPADIDWVWIDSATGLRGDGCEKARRYPFIEGSAPGKAAPCARQAAEDPVNTARNWLRSLFE
ncbi:MAG: penicillin-binding protein 1B [Chromatiales bacterium]|nr:penicillin-binding protein 1B [Chromatiales bacterium]